MNKNVLVQLNVKADSRDHALMQISDFAFKNKVIEKESDIQLLYKSFKKREDDSTTAFEDGFAIPHARIEAIKKPTIIISKFDKINNWEAIDKSKVSITIALLVPKKDEGSVHIEILSKIATLLLNEDFRKNLKSLNDENSLKNYILNQLNTSTNKTSETNIESDINIVGVSACATGVAHTYMAKEALEKAGKELGWNVKIETQGQKGIEFKVTEEEINKADAVVFATDIYVDPERFTNKKFLKVNTNDAIHNAKKVLQESLKQEVKGNKSKTNNHNKSGSEQFKNPVMKVFMGHLLSGVSRMIPFIVFSGILWAIFNSIGAANEQINNNEVFKIAKQITEIGFTVFIAMMGGFIAESIAGRAGLAPGFIATFAAANSSLTFWWNINGWSGIPRIETFFPNAEKLGISNVSLSLFAAIIMGFAAGYLVKWVLTWKTHKLITPLIPIIFIPVVCTSVIVFPFIFLLSGPLGYLMNGLVFGISEAGRIPVLNFFIGCLLGAMIGFDMGGPINKIAGTTATSLITIDPRLMGAVASAIPIAPLGCGLATLIGRKLFSTKERAEGITALGLGFFGISEGAIPFAVNNPKKVLIANMIGSSIAGGLSFLFFVGGYVGMWGGPITAFVLGVKAPISQLTQLNTTIPSIFGGQGNGMEFISILWFFVAIAIGTVIHAFLLIFMLKFNNEERNSWYLSKLKIFREKLNIKNLKNRRNKKNKLRQ